MKRSVLLPLLAAVLLPLAAVAAEETADAPKSMIAVRTGKAPVIDGRLDDEVWKDATADDRFVQQQPAEHQAPTEKTELRVLYDDEALYVGIHCLDSQPGEIVARLTRRDRDVESDWVGVVLDSRNDHSSAYAFRVNAAGVQTDALWFNDTERSSDWDAVWSSAVSNDAQGWSAEMRIPLSVLRFSSKDIQQWGFQSIRHISRKKEDDWWTYVPTTVQGFVSRIGTMDGLRGLRPGRTFEVRPYFATRLTADSDSGGTLLAVTPGGRSETAMDAGLDLKLGLTSDLTLDATVNPDFGQVEADQVVLNLSRFESFFPEKRPFFLEGADLFSTPIQLFYSRRIGRPPSGLGSGDLILGPEGDYLTVSRGARALRIWSAAKITGKVSDRMQIGLLEGVTGNEVTMTDAGISGEREVETAPVRSYSVARARYDFGGSSYLGVIATAVKRLGGELYFASTNHDAYTQAVDGTWVISDHARLNAQAALSERVGGTAYKTLDGTPCPAGKADPDCVPVTRPDGTRMEPGAVGWGANAQLRGDSTHAIYMGQYQVYSPTLDVNDLGFNTQFDFHELRGFGGYRETKPKGPFLNWDTVLGGFAALDYEGTPRKLLNFYVLEGTLKNFWYFNVELDWQWPGAYDILETLDGGRLEVPLGYGGGLGINSDSRQPVVVNSWSHYYFFGDGSFDVGGFADVSFQLFPQLELTLTPDAGVTRATRFYDCTGDSGRGCIVDDLSRHYTFALLDSSYVSLTLRGTWTFSPRMSLQAYAQLFADRGEYSQYRNVDTIGTRPKIHFDDMGASTFGGDTDGDGMKDDDFQDVSLNLNIVLRWEFLPGSTLIGVFTRAQNGAYVPDGKSPTLRFSGLSAGPTEDVILMKLVYFFG